MNDPVIDLDGIENLKAVVGNDPELLAEFVEVFTRSVPDQVDAMRTAYTKNDFAGLRIAAHSCKSNSRDMGATTLANLCAILEIQSRAEDLTHPEAQIATIEMEAQRAIEALNALDFGNV